MKTQTESTTGASRRPVSRRGFLRAAATTGAGAAFLGAIPTVRSVLGQESHGDAYVLSQPDHQIHTICQQCNTQCGIKVKLIDGVAAKIDGNPYSPWNLIPHLNYELPVKETAMIDAPICPKGQAGLQAAYDPMRIVQVLKRAGKRGENKWETIPFDQAVTEIVDGGKLFASVPGEENREVEGLRQLRAVTDAKLLTAMGTAVKAIWAESDATKKKALVEKFKVDFKDDLDKMIDPEHPDFGPKNNQILYFWGRKKGGRSDIAARFFGSGLGTTNRHGHTTVCQGSLYFAGKGMADQWDGSKFTGGAKAYWQGDAASSSFIVFVGASPFEGNYGPTNRVPRITSNLASGNFKYAVIDPRLSKTAAKAWRWLPNKPGSEAAIALAMTQWIIEKHRFDETYLSSLNKAAATKAGEPTWCNASWLVKVVDGRPGKFLRGTDLKLVEKVDTEVDGKKVSNWVATGGVKYTTNPFVGLGTDGNPVLFDPNDSKNVAVGQPLVSTTVQGIQVKSGLQVLFESSSEKSIDEWAEIAGLDPAAIIELATEFTSHGKNSAFDIHRGVSQHTNGYYNVLAWNALGLLIGNYDWRGGQVYASTYDISGAKAEGPFKLGSADPGALSPFGISLIRHGNKFEETTLFDGNYPAKRNWYPLASDVYEEIIPSAGDAYPYPIKAAFMYMGSPVYSLPAGNTWIPILQDVEKLPLFVASDIIVGETSMYADYIFPDVTFLERWEFGGSHPSITFKVQGVRQPTIAPLTPTVTVYGEEMAMQFEALLMAMAEKLELPNFGPNGLGKGVDYNHPDDLYLRMVANLGFGEVKDGSDSVKPASEEEIATFVAARAHLPKAVFEVERWKRITGDQWPLVVAVLERGGRFQAYEKGYPGDGVRPGSFDEPYIVPTGTKFGKLINMYLENNVSVKHSGTGKPLSPVAAYVQPSMAFDGTVLDDRGDGYDLNMITYREIMGTKSRTSGNYWLKALLPENQLLMNEVDAEARKIKDGDRVRITSKSNPDGEWDFGNGDTQAIEGAVKVIQGIRPGVVAFALGFGHWAYGSQDITVNGDTIKGDKRRMLGFHANAAMRQDPGVTATALFDPVGGSAVFYDSTVKVEKA